jgi:hypothetical protein
MAGENVNCRGKLFDVAAEIFLNKALEGMKRSLKTCLLYGKVKPGRAGGVRFLGGVKAISLHKKWV